MLLYIMGKRFSKQDWIDLGTRALRSEGPEALTVERLCELAEKTRGSFYFHFETTESFLNAIAEDWHKTFTEAVIGRNLPQSDRLDLLNQLATRLDLDLETGMRQLAMQSLPVLEIVGKADRERTDWLAGLYEASGNYQAEEAQALAKIEYAAFTGFKLIEPDLQPGEAKKLYDAFLRFTDRA